MEVSVCGRPMPDYTLYCLDLLSSFSVYAAALLDYLLNLKTYSESSKILKVSNTVL
jgi:hypothetical protein